MNQRHMMYGLAMTFAVATFAGCTMQYNGAWSFSEEAFKVSEPNTSSNQAPGMAELKGRHPRPKVDVAPEPAPTEAFATDDTTDPDGVNAAVMRPVVQTVGAQRHKKPAFSTPYRPHEYAQQQVSTQAPEGGDRIGLFGGLPESEPTNQSPLDSPDNIGQITFTVEGADFDPEVDPSGKLIAYASTRHREQADIYVQKIGGTTVTQLTNDPAKDIMPTWSPDGSRIAFASDRGGNWDIYVMDASGGQAQQVTNSPTHDLHPSFSPDGKQMAYCSYGANSGQWEVVVIDLKNPASRQIIAHGMFPQWSPKGDKILFQRARERGTRWFSVWTVELIDGEARKATEIVAANNAATITPAWSPDGQFVAFSTVVTPDLIHGGAPVQADVWIVAADGSGRANLTNNNFANTQPAWAADGSIYFVSNRGKSGVENIWSVRPDQALRLTQPAPSPDNTAKTSEKAEPTAAVPTNE